MRNSILARIVRTVDILGMRNRASEPRAQAGRRRLAIQPLEQRCLLAGLPVISEFMAVNDSTLLDVDGEYNDWIEIYNAGDAVVDLAGWHLTDDAGNLTKWTFPSESLGPGEFLVVFASDKNRAVAGQQLHTNFKLTSDGEYLALVRPDAVTVASAYAPQFPAQFDEVSYGFAFSGNPSSTIVTLTPGNDARDTWIRKNAPNTVWQSDAMSTFAGPADVRYGVVQFDLSDVDGVIIGAHLELWNRNNGAVTLAPALWVDSSAWAGDLSSFTWNNYLAAIQPVQTAFAQLGGGAFPAGTPSMGSYGPTNAATAADAAVLEAIRQGDGLVTLVFTASSGARDWGDWGLDNRPVKLVLQTSEGADPFEIHLDQQRYFTTPTPGGPNADGYLGLVADTASTVDRGFFTAPFNTVLSTETPGATLVYTLDGAPPTLAHGTQVLPANANAAPSVSIHVDGTTVLRVAAFKDGWLSTNVDTFTFLFVDDVVRQSPNGQAPPGWPTNPVNGQRFDYGMDPEIVQGAAGTADFDNDGDVTQSDYAIMTAHWLQTVPAGTLGDMNYDGQVNLQDFTLFKAAFHDATTAASVRDGLLSIPTLSIVTDLANFNDPATGIYVNAGNSGREWERPVSLELLFPDGSAGSQVEAGVRIRGGFSLSDANPKHSFRLFFRGEYGDGRWNFPLFGAEGVDSFDKLDLRTSQNDAWAWQNSPHMTMADDVFSRDTQRDMGQPYTRSRYYHLYINGVYWGLYQSQERSEAAFGADYFGGDEANFDVVKSAGGSGGYTTEATDGNLDAWQSLWSQARAGVADNADYYRLQGLNPDGTRNPAYPVLLDVDNLIDYMLVIFYTGDEDAPLSLPLQNNRSNNWFALRDRTSDEGFKFFAHDAEQWGFSKHSQGGLYADRTGPFTGSNQDNFLYSNPQWLHQDLMANADYRLRFADRVQAHFFNDGALTPENTAERFLARTAEIATAMLAESARWGDASPGREDDPFTQDDWQTAVDRMVNDFFPYRTNIVYGQLAADGLTTPLAVPSLAVNGQPQFGGEVDAGDQLSFSGGAAIYYTLDGSDPRLPGGALSPSAQLYGVPVALAGSVSVNARALVGGVWSALAHAEFTVELPPLRITELMYHPASGALEYVEVANIGGAPLNLAGFTLSVGINFTFPNISLSSGQHVVVVESAAAFQAAYGTSIVIAGQYSGALSNGGERLALADSGGRVILDFVYDDGWQPTTDGGGYSLVIVDPLAAPAAWNHATNWRPSSNLGGSPGGVDPEASGSAPAVLAANTADVAPTAEPSPAPGLGIDSAPAATVNVEIAIGGAAAPRPIARWSTADAVRLARREFNVARPRVAVSPIRLDTRDRDQARALLHSREARVEDVSPGRREVARDAAFASEKSWARELRFVPAWRQSK